MTKEKITKMKKKKLKGKKLKKSRDGEESLGLKKEVRRNDISQETKTTIWMSDAEHMEFKIDAMRLGIPLYEHLYNLIMLGDKRFQKMKNQE